MEPARSPRVLDRCLVAALTALAAACGGGGRASYPVPAPTAPTVHAPDLVTAAERSGWTRTGRYDEAIRLCQAFAARHPARASCETFATTPERRPMLALIVGDRDAGRPVVLVQGGIHAGEIDGKDAGFWFLRELLAGAVAPGALDHVTFVFVPVLNPDGHERFGPAHRPNQRGPEETGFRTNAANLNLNRDYVKVDTPEMAALLALWRRFDPVVYVDLHATDGAKFEHDVAVMVHPRAPRPDALGAAATALSDRLQARLAELGHLPLSFYPSFEADDDPASGFADGEAPPRFSNGYAAARGRLGVLVETHSWRPYGERVRATFHVLQILAERAAEDAPRWRAAADAADVADAALAGREVVLAHRATAQARTIEFRGYRYERRPSEVSGGTWTIYDEAAPAIWRVPLRDQLEPAVTVRAPGAGYLVTAGYADVVAARLAAHGIRSVRLERELAVDAEVFRVAEVSHAPPFEGRSRATLTGAWTRERRVVAPGALWVPIDQPRGRLVLHLFEPTGPDSLASWGFFSATLEQKEYMEAYVAEEVARQMLADPEVRRAFDEALRDEAFARSPQRRLEFFYRRHPSWDERKGLLPVVRLDAPPPGAAATP